VLGIGVGAVVARPQCPLPDRHAPPGGLQLPWAIWACLMLAMLRRLTTQPAGGPWPRSWPTADHLALVLLVGMTRPRTGHHRNRGPLRMLTLAGGAFHARPVPVGLMAVAGCLARPVLWLNGDLPGQLHLYPRSPHPRRLLASGLTAVLCVRSCSIGWASVGSTDALADTPNQLAGGGYRPSSLSNAGDRCRPLAEPPAGA